MEKIIVYVDDAAFARERLASLLADIASKPEASKAAVHWLVVACAPRMTHRISKWVSHSARENWRAKWFAKTQEQLQPVLRRNGDQIHMLLAKGPLTELTQQLRMTHGAATVVDMRRPKVGVDLEPVAPDQTPPHASGWALPGAVVGMGALLVLANELGD
ncbi:hypothetical protein QTI66_24265 [Variovorax sp. J22R133]|uniref:hypothetical protein n=1 Tax=Variovorax brevis TaxID=3053503 RepID=UPI002576FC9C|nr:hypothetical protein [Variovorax sp. J22R133]MDM0115287.1 hypothetical protein [Variovorax sp. J22R133]